MPLYYPTVGKLVVGKVAPVNYNAEQIEKIFLDCDVDGNKVLSREELKRAFDRLGSHHPGFRAWRALWRADANNDGVISMDELKCLVNYAGGLGYRIS